MDQVTLSLSKQDPRHASPHGLRVAQPRRDRGRSVSGVAWAPRKRRRTDPGHCAAALVGPNMPL